MKDIDNYFLHQNEPVKSCLTALRYLILNQRENITEVWRYQMPFYCLRKHNGIEERFCYLWVDKNKRLPYIGVVDGNLIEHPDLIAEKRSRMKIMLLDPEKDLPIEQIKYVLDKAISLIDQ